jgi:hypothetical protein
MTDAGAVAKNLGAERPLSGDMNAAPNDSF